MKSLKIFGLFASLVVLMASCKDDFLEEKRDFGGFNEQSYSDPQLAQQYVDYVYSLFLPANNATSLNWNLAVNGDNFSKTTEEFGGSTDWNKPWGNVSYLNSHALSYFGTPLPSSVNNNTWTRIRQINLFLDNVDKYNVMTVEQKKQLKGQLYFWRAFQYFDLVRLYGGVPIVLHAQNPIGGGTADIATPRSKTSECITQIVADLDSAMQMLPAKWADSNWGRISGAAAAAEKGRVLLTWASPLFNPNDDQARWEQAYQANKTAFDMLKSNGFGLDPDWANMWFKKGSANTEGVIVYGFNNVVSGDFQRNNGWENAARPRDLNGGGSLSPTKQMLDIFPMKDGKMPASSKYAYSDQKFYKDRDPRFYNTFAYNGSLWPYNEDKSFRLWTYMWKKTANSKIYDASTEVVGRNGTGIYMRKATSPSASKNNANGDFKFSATPYMEMRFAEVVLNLAEAAAATNRLDESMTLVTSIRQRAGLESADNYGLGAVGSRDQMIANVLRERRIELAFEGKWFFDLRRWMLFNDDHHTVTRLGFKSLNGTRRTGIFIVPLKADGTEYVGTADPMIAGSNGSAIIVNRQPAGVNDAYIDELYSKYFKIVVKDDVDPVSPADWAFTWYDQYYYFGINQSVLNVSTYLEQTKGWDSQKGAGTFDPLL